MHGNDPRVLEKEKMRNLSGKTPNTHDGAPGWNETLATASEAHVKADKSNYPLHELQRTTVELIRKKKTLESESEEADGVTASTAYTSYSKDEVTGPLSGAKGKEEVITTSTIKRRGGGAAQIDNSIREPDAVVAEYLKREGLMTPSEEDVAADRGEFNVRP